MLNDVGENLFFLRKSSPFRKGPWLLNLRITVDGIAKELSLKRRWEISRWNSDKQRAAGTKEDAKALNVYIDLILAKAHAARTNMIEKEQHITAKGIKDVLSIQAQTAIDTPIGNRAFYTRSKTPPDSLWYLTKDKNFRWTDTRLYKLIQMSIRKFSCY